MTDKQKACDCRSYNADTGKTPEVIARLPDDSGKDVCLDACIAGTIQELWRRGIFTEGSCCGHNKIKPSIVLSVGEDMKKCAAILAEIDQREWEISQWQRIVYAPAALLHAATQERKESAP